MKNVNSQKLSRKTLTCYAFAGMGSNAVIAFISLCLVFFYTEVAKLSYIYVGYALAIAMLADALSDPIMGYISDNLNWKGVRLRKPFLVIGAIPSAIALFLVFSPPQTSQWNMFIYLTINMIALRTFLTIFLTPYFAMSPELSEDYDERIRISAYRKFMENLGDASGIIIPGIIVSLAPLVIMSYTFDEASLYGLAAATIGLLLILTSFITYIGTEQPKNTWNQAEYGFFEGITGVFQNKAFCLILLALVLTCVSDRIVYAELMYIFHHYHEKSLGDFIGIMFFYLLGSVIGVPVWNALANAKGKKYCYIVTLLVYPVTLVFLVITRWSDAYLCLFFAISGMAVCGAYMMPLALLPDIIEWDELKTGQRREGAYMGLVTFGIKIGMAISLLLLAGVLYSIDYKEGEDTRVFSLVEEKAVQDIVQEELNSLEKRLERKLEGRLDNISLKWSLEDQLRQQKYEVTKRKNKDEKNKDENSNSKEDGNKKPDIVDVAITNLDKEVLVPDHKLYESLDEGVFLPELKGEFLKADIKLSDNLTLKVQTKSANWLLTDHDNKLKFFLNREKGILSVLRGQSKKTIDLLRLNFALIPIIILYLGAFFFRKFPITKEKHAEMLAELDKARGQ